MKLQNFIISTLLLLIPTIIVAEETVKLRCHSLIQGDHCIISQLEDDFSNKNVVVDTGSIKPKAIKLKNVHLGRLPNSFIIDHENVQELTLKSCHIYSLDNVKNLKNLQKLELEHNNISEVGEYQLDNPLLEELDLEDNEINVIHVNAFKHTPMLKNLDVSHNKLHTLNKQNIVNSLETIKLKNNLFDNIENMFNEHPNLKRIDLEGNKITKITSNTFKNSHEIFILKMAKNSIQTIDNDAFDTLESMQLLELSDNLLKSLHVNIVSDYMGHLTVSRNQLTNLVFEMKVPELKRKFTFKANSNKLENVALPDKINYKKIDLKNNPLKNLPAENILKTVEFLYLDNIDLTNHHLTALKDNENLISISLNGTGISKKDFEMLLKHPSVVLIDVSHNKQLADFDFSSINNGAPKLETLELNYCNLQSLNKESLKNVFPKLKHLDIA